MSRRRTATGSRVDRDEESFVGWLQTVADPGIGDDAAFVRLAGSYAWTVDSQHEGVHLPRGCDPVVAARRLLAVNLSDLAAVGAAPRFALLALAAPAAYDRRRFVAALLAAAAAAGVRLMGGDVSRLDTWSATLTLIGRRWSGARWLRRGDARPGDDLYVGGTLGEAALGLALLQAGASWQRGGPRLPRGFSGGSGLERAAKRALRRQLLPSPQLELSRHLARSGRRVAAIDVSDGLGKDLARLCAASGVGADLDTLPLAPRAAELAARLGLDARSLAIGGGEDYVLLFTLPRGATPPSGCFRIGRVSASAGVRLESPDGRRRQIAAAGFDHFADPGDASRARV
jgi:thiamine-monophosphate kinase